MSELYNAMIKKFRVSLNIAAFCVICYGHIHHPQFMRKIALFPHKGKSDSLLLLSHFSLPILNSFFFSGKFPLKCPSLFILYLNNLARTLSYIASLQIAGMYNFQ